MRIQAICIGYPNGYRAIGGMVGKDNLPASIFPTAAHQCRNIVGNVLTITGRGYAPRELTRVSALVWTLSISAVKPAISPPQE